MHPVAEALVSAAGPLLAHGGRGGGGAAAASAVCAFLVPMGAIVVLIAALFYVGYLRDKKRTEDLQRVAKELGFDFFPEYPELFAVLARFHLFSQGHGKQIKNVLRGEARGLTAEIFDYRYTTGGGKSSATWRQTAICFHLDGRPLPAFSLRPESVFDRIGAWFGAQDINFEDHPAFSKMYLLQGPDEQAIRDLFADPVLAFYEGRPGLNTEGGGSRLLFYRHNKQVEPTGLLSFLEEGFEVLAAFRPPAEPPDKRTV
jgi:hypothetical protein